MKKLTLLLLGLSASASIGFSLDPTPAWAETPITGWAEGENLGILHPDYSSAVNPLGPVYDPSYNVGGRSQFYIDLDDPEFTGPGSEGFAATISNPAEPSEMCDETEQTCPLNGFMWSDAIGWIALDGSVIQDELDALEYPDSLFPKISYSGFMNGLAWSQKTGWIQLSACAGAEEAACDALPGICQWDAGLSACQVRADAAYPDPQTSSEWGVHLDFSESSDVELADCPAKEQAACQASQECSWDADACEFEGTPRGRPFHGYAWSQSLGWIKFGSEAGDPYDFAAYTTWYPDETPPELNVDPLEDHLWFANQSAIGSIIWENLASDEDSGIDSAASTLLAALDPSPDFAGCESGTGTGVEPSISPQGNSADANFPLMGLLSSAPYGFCKYTLTGEIVNGAGLSFYLGDPDGLLPPEITGDPLQYQDAISFYVRAGDLDLSQSSLAEADPGSKIADGVDTVEFRFSPKDAGGNPIVPIRVSQAVDTSGGSIVLEPDEANWMRDVEIAFAFDTSALFFDTVDPTQTPGNLPIRLSDSNPSLGGSTYSVGPTVTYPSGGLATLLPSSNAYPIKAVAYSPTSNCGAGCSNSLQMTSISLRTIDAALPAVTVLASPTPALTSDYLVDQGSVLSGPNPLSASFDFLPALLASQPALDAETLAIGQPVTATFSLSSQSQNVFLDELAVDNLLEFVNTGGLGFGEEVLEIYDIDQVGAADGASGRSDPISGNSRYELLSLSGSGVNSTPGQTVFHSSATNHHSPSYSFYYDFVPTPANLDSEGVYLASSALYGSDSDISIDRADALSGASPLLPANASTPISIRMTPVQTLGLGFEQQVEFALSQYLAYRISDPGANLPPGFTEFAVYANPAPLSGVEVKNLGFQTSGLVSGEQVYQSVGGRSLGTVSTAASDGLRRTIRSNAADLARNATPCPAAPLTELSIAPSDCVLVNEADRSIVAIYEGDPGQTLALGEGGNTLLVPDGYRYTLILKGGADLFIRDNLVYSGSGSLGMIVLESDGGEGGNVYLDPRPTNLVGLLYSEGSLLSSPNGSTLYYGDGADSGDLDNQLYWTGAIASFNTIGGAPNLALPNGISCPPGTDPLACAQRYDLDYLRRFGTSSVLEGDYSAPGSLYSGGGSCNATPTCLSGPLPSTVSLNASALIDPNASLSLDPFFLQRNSRPVPAGFSSERELNQSSVLR